MAEPPTRWRPFGGSSTLRRAPGPPPSPSESLLLSAAPAASRAARGALARVPPEEPRPLPRVPEPRAERAPPNAGPEAVPLEGGSALEGAEAGAGAGRRAGVAMWDPGEKFTNTVGEAATVSLPSRM